MLRALIRPPFFISTKGSLNLENILRAIGDEKWDNQQFENYPRGIFNFSFVKYFLQVTFLWFCLNRDFK